MANEDAARPVDHMGFDAGRDEAEDLLLQPLAVHVVLFVPDHEVDRESLQPPPRVGLHHLPHEVDVAGLADLHQHDRQVARNRIAPQARLAAPVAQQHRTVGAQRRLRIGHRAGQPRVQLGVGLGRVQLAQHDLAVRPGELEDAVGEPAVDVFGEQRDAGIARVGHAVDHVDRRRLLGLERDDAARRGHRVEHRAGAARQRAGHAHRLRCIQLATAADEARAVGLVRRRPGLRTVHRHQVAHPRHRLFG